MPLNAGKMLYLSFSHLARLILSIEERACVVEGARQRGGYWAVRCVLEAPRIAGGLRGNSAGADAQAEGGTCTSCGIERDTYLRIGEQET